MKKLLCSHMYPFNNTMRNTQKKVLTKINNEIDVVSLLACDTQKYNKKNNTEINIER